MKKILNAVSGRLIHPSKGSFWEWKIDGPTLTNTSGKLGKAGRETSKKHPSAEKAEKDLESKHYKKLKEGFLLLADDNSGPIALQACLGNSYTGSMSMDMDPVGERIVAGRHVGDGSKKCEVVILDSRTGGELKVFGLDEFDISVVRFYEDQLLIQIDDRILTLDIDRGRTKVLSEGGVFPNLKFDLQANRLLHAYKGESGPLIGVTDLATQESLLEIDASVTLSAEIHKSHYIGVLSPSGAKAAVCIRPGEVDVYDLDKGTHQVIHGDFPCLLKMKFDPSEQWICTCAYMGNWNFSLISLKDGSEDNRFHVRSQAGSAPRPRTTCFDFDFSPDGKRIVLREYDRLAIYDFQSAKELLQIQQRHAVQTSGTGGFVLRYISDHQILTRTDRGVITVYDLSQELK